MKRREMLVMSLAAAFLSACGGGRNSSEAPEGSSQSTRLLPSTEIHSVDSETRRFLLAGTDLLQQRKNASEFVKDPEGYFVALGFQPALLTQYATLTDALAIICSPDFETSMAINDTSFLVSRSGTLKSLYAGCTVRQISNDPLKNQLLISDDVNSTAKLITLTERDISELFRGKNKQTDIGDMLLMVVAYGMKLTESETLGET